MEHTKVDLWTRWVGWWCSVVSVQVRRSSAMVTAVLGFATVGVRASETERVRVESERPASSPLQHGDAGSAMAYGCHMVRVR